MSIDWDQEWTITSPGGGLAKDDRIKFESSAQFHVKQGPSPFASKGTYFPASLTPSVKACQVTTGSAVYTVVYQENLSPKKDELICISSSHSYGGTASATSDLNFLSWVLGVIVGVFVSLGVSLSLDVPIGNALLIATASALFTVMASKAADYFLKTADHGPGGPSWTAEEGGLRAGEINDLLVTAQK